MPRHQQYTLKGLNLRSNSLSKSVDHASDILNMVQDSEGNWVKRNGYDDIATQASALDSVLYKTLDYQMCLVAGGIKKKNGATFDSVTFGGIAPASWTVPVSFKEYSGVLYWSDPAGAVDLWKYDGYMQYKAGLPKPTVALLADAGGGTRYFRFAYRFIDMQGNEFYGDYTELGPYGVNSTFTFNTLNGSEYWCKHAVVGAVGETIDSTNLSLEVAAGRNYVAGDCIRGLTTTGIFVPLIVESVGATSIVFTAASVGAYSFDYTSAGMPVERRLFGVQFVSSNSSYGYVLADQNIIDFNAPSFSTSAVTITTTPMEDVYDTTNIKGLPPRFKYIDVYASVMVGANNGQPQGSYSASGSVTPRNKFTIYWGDITLGSNPMETFAPLDYEIVGRSDEGEINGLISSGDSLIIGKQRQVYYLNGILTGRAFSLRSSKSAGIGCTSHKSMGEIPDGAVFQSYKGIYFAQNGQTPQELSDIIEPLFTSDTVSLDLTSARCLVIAEREKMYMFIPAASSANDIVLVYDYYFKTWTILKSISARKGFYYYNSLIHHFDNSATPTLYNETSAKNDNGAAINAYYATEWDDRGVPGLIKKYLRFVLFSLNPSATWTAYFKTQKNWIETNLVDTTIPITTTGQIYGKGCSVDDAHSMRFIIGNNTVNESALICGFDLEYSLEQTQEKSTA